MPIAESTRAVSTDAGSESDLKCDGSTSIARMRQSCGFLAPALCFIKHRILVNFHLLVKSRHILIFGIAQCFYFLNIDLSAYQVSHNSGADSEW